MGLYIEAKGQILITMSIADVCLNVESENHAFADDIISGVESTLLRKVYAEHLKKKCLKIM